MRIPQKTGHKGSLKWIQKLINQHPAIFNRAIANQLRPKLENIQWLSPLLQDNFSEYRDEDFLSVLGLSRFSGKLKHFWPRHGPQWDALGRAGEDGPFFLVEAKANIPEITSSMQASSSTSIALIRKSLNKTANYLSRPYSDLWENGFYQYVNRLAHLYFLRQVCGLDIYLVFLYFIGDFTHLPTSREQWEGALELQKSLLGLKRNKLGKYIVEAYINIVDIQ